MNDRTHPDTTPVADDRVTPEVGDEGGTPGDVETRRERTPVAGSEATETWSPADPANTEVRRDETGTGRRSP